MGRRWYSKAIDEIYLDTVAVLGIRLRETHFLRQLTAIFAPELLPAEARFRRVTLRLLSELELGEEVRRKGMTIVGRKIHSLEAQNRVISVDCSHLTAPQSIALAQSVARFSNSGKYAGGLLWIADWGISNESTENLAQFCVDKLRDGHVALTNAPAHELHKSDQLLTEALVMQTMVFRWGAYFIPERADHYIEISDDEAIIIFCLNEDVIDRALDYFSHWKPTVMDW